MADNSDRGGRSLRARPRSVRRLPHPPDGNAGCASPPILPVGNPGRAAHPAAGARSLGCFGLWLGAGLPGLITQAAEETNGLRPPRPLLEPTFLEQHGGLALGLAGGVLLVAALVFWWLRRPRPAAGVPPEPAARQALLALQGQPEDAALALRVSQALRRYLHTVLALPGEELTPAEVEAALRSHPLGGEELAGRVAALLRDCDLWKFAPTPPPAPAGLAARAWELAQEVAQRRAALSVPGAG